MRRHGKLTRWDAARGVGSISPDDGSADLAVRMASMPRDGMRPQIGEPLSFEVESAEGAPRAVNVWRHGPRLSNAEAARGRRVGAERVRAVLIAVAVVAVGLIAWKWLR
jgi:cold shock CspA family protein